MLGEVIFWLWGIVPCPFDSLPSCPHFQLTSQQFTRGFLCSLTVCLFEVGRALGRQGEARRELQVKEARLVDAAGRETRVPAAAVAVGQRVRVLPGDRVPVDGVVVAGRSLVNEAMLTGEAEPVAKAPGSRVTRCGLPRCCFVVFLALFFPG